MSPSALHFPRKVLQDLHANNLLANSVSVMNRSNFSMTSQLRFVAGRSAGAFSEAQEAFFRFLLHIFCFHHPSFHSSVSCFHRAVSPGGVCRLLAGWSAQLSGVYSHGPGVSLLLLHLRAAVEQQQGPVTRLWRWGVMLCFCLLEKHAQ